MTPQEAQAAIAALTATITPASSRADVLAAQSRLGALIDTLPPTPDFKLIRAAIRALTLQLDQQLTGAVIQDLRSRTDALGAAVAALAKVASDAASDSRVLSFEQPRLIVAGLNNGIALVQQLQNAVQQQNIAAVQQNAEAVLAILNTLQENIRTT